jgi:periplasmic divalent cation tolerance protein
MNEFVVALTTVPASFDATALAKALVDRRLAACVNVLPGVTSVYRWEGAVQTDTEQQLVIKTTADKVQALDDAIKALSPYDVPEFIVLPIVAGNPDYLNWLDAD